MVMVPWLCTRLYQFISYTVKPFEYEFIFEEVIQSIARLCCGMLYCIHILVSAIVAEKKLYVVQYEQSFFFYKTRQVQTI